MIMIADMWSYPKNWSNWYPKRIWWRKRSGDQLACSSRADGYIIWYISQSRIFCYFDVPRRRSRRSNAIVCTHSHSLLHSHTHTLYQHQHTAYIHISGQIQLTYGAAATATAQLVVAAQLLGRRLLNKTHAHSYTLTSAMLYVVLNTYCPASVFIICIDFFNIQLYWNFL